MNWKYFLEFCDFDFSVVVCIKFYARSERKKKQEILQFLPKGCSFDKSHFFSLSQLNSPKLPYYQ